MNWLEKIAEDRIKQAQDEGVFDNLPGKGKPFEFEDDSLVPEDLRLTYKILKNSKCLPVELELRREIYSLRQLLDAATDEETRRELRKELRLLTLNLDVRRQSYRMA
jgi:hypothetical protein